MNASVAGARPQSATWEQLFQRFAEFQAMPCVVGTGPGMKRPDETITFNRLHRRFLRDRDQLPDRPRDLTQEHIDRVLGLSSVIPAERRPPSGHQSLWSGIWRAIILDRDDYCCQICKRSGKDGLVIGGQLPLALRLELDHIVPRAEGGPDYVLANIRTLCRTCNLIRGRLKDVYFQAELRSFAAAISKAFPVRSPSAT